ncbi:sensor histidine kinase [Halioxenophilus aromaticivorans]|uniref:Alginate biosynthesis two-component system sensor histidine kinase AlgZ n=1 Tax=Halioxenophilus aromaticivorans TaxID=1306992 RepID=A0AAV3U590_9ALTE
MIVSSPAGDSTHTTAPATATLEPRAFLPDLCSLQSVLFLVLGTGLLAVAIVLVSSPLNEFSWELLGQLAMLLLWISLSSAGLLCQSRIWLGRLPSWVAGGLSYLLILLLASFFTIAGQWLVWPAFDWLVVLKVLLLTAIIAGVVLRYMYLQQQLSYQQQASNRAQINALQARIRPHFLFNSLNAVVSLIGFDPIKAERVVLDLCDLFRASIAEPTLVSLASELKLARQYIAIEDLRLDNRLRVEWLIDGEVESCRIPSMILQPLLENAVYHGIEPLPAGGTVKVDISVKGGVCDLRIINPRPESAAVRRGNGMAEGNIRARLQAHFGEQVVFTSLAQGDEYCVHLRYNWHHSRLEAATKNVK